MPTALEVALSDAENAELLRIADELGLSRDEAAARLIGEHARRIACPLDMTGIVIRFPEPQRGPDCGN